MLPLVTLKRNSLRGSLGPAARRRTDYHHGDLRASAIRGALAILDARQSLPPLRELAAACGVAHPSLYRHFDNGEALALSVAAVCFREFAQEIRAASAAEALPPARLRAGCAASIRWGLAHPARYALMMGPELAGKQHHEEFFLAAKEAFDGLVGAVGACGVPDAVPVAHTIMSALHGLIDLLRKGRTIPHKAATVDEQVDAMLEMVLQYAGLRSRRVAAAGGGAKATPAPAVSRSAGRGAGRIRARGVARDAGG